MTQSAWRVLLLALLAAPAVGYAEEIEGTTADDEPVQAEPARRHRIDFGMEWFDAAEGSSAIGFLNYAWVPHPSHALATTLLLVGSDFGETEGSGIGDLRVQYSWAPSVELSASPWVPNAFGLGFGLIVPTGDPAKGTGDDRWVAIPTFGWVAPIGRRFSILPTLQYFETFNEGPDGIEFSAANLELGFVYVTRSGFWFNYTPSVFRDLEPVEDTNIDHSFTVGKQFRVFGVSLQLGTVERGEIQGDEFSADSDKRAALVFHFVLPW